MIHNPVEAIDENDDKAMRWWIVQTAPRQEHVAVARLSEKRFEVYCPWRTCTVRHARQERIVRRPLFVGYIIVRCRRTEFFDARMCYGVERFVPAKSPIPVATSLILALMEAEKAGAFDETRKPEAAVVWQAGQKVRITVGPLEGFIGQVVRSTPKGRVDMLLDMLGGARPVTVKSGALELAEA